MLSKIQTVRKTKMRVTDSVTLESGITCPVIQGQLSQVGVISQNGYRYDPGFWNIIVEEPVRSMIQQREMLGMIEHPKDDAEYLQTPYEKASHIVIDAWLDDDGNPYGKFALLNNSYGNAMKALVDVGHQPGVSTRGLGDIIKDSTSEVVSPTGYALITWDLVRRPNFASLKMEKVSDSLQNSQIFKEVCEMYKIRDSINVTPGITRESILKEIKSGISELQQKYDQLIQLL